MYFYTHELQVLFWTCVWDLSSKQQWTAFLWSSVGMVWRGYSNNNCLDTCTIIRFHCLDFSIDLEAKVNVWTPWAPCLLHYWWKLLYHAGTIALVLCLFGGFFIILLLSWMTLRAWRWHICYNAHICFCDHDTRLVALSCSVGLIIPSMC